MCRLFVAIPLVVISLLSSGSTSLATPPPADYPTSSIKATVVDVTGISIPIRTGFWDSTAGPRGEGQGWGFDKAFNYHNITDVEAMRFVLQSPQKVQQGLQATYTAYANENICDVDSCTAINVIEVRGVYDSQAPDLYYGYPTGGQIGLLTMYCVQGGQVRCPDWVTTSLRNGLTGPATSGGSAKGTTADTISQERYTASYVR